MALADKIPGFAPTRNVTEQDGHFIVTVTPPSFIGLPGASVKLTKDQFDRYNQWRNKDGMIQDLLPELSIVDREILMSGIGAEDFNCLFPEDDE